MNLVQFFLVGLAGWVHRHLQHVIEYLQEEVKVLKERLGRRPRFNDDQRRRLAAKANEVSLSRFKKIVVLATSHSLLASHQRLIARECDSSAKPLSRLPTYGCRGLY